jgi:hypothetical protein
MSRRRTNPLLFVGRRLDVDLTNGLLKPDVCLQPERGARSKREDKELQRYKELLVKAIDPKDVGLLECSFLDLEFPGH